MPFEQSAALRKGKSWLPPRRSFPGIDCLRPFRINRGNDLNLNVGTFRQAGDLHGRARRRVGFEIRAVNLVHSLEIGEICQENGRLDDVFETKAFRPQHRRDILHHPTCLLSNFSVYDPASLRVQGNLTGTKHEIAASDGLRVRSDGCRRLRGRNGFLHGATLAVLCAMSSNAETCLITRRIEADERFLALAANDKWGKVADT